MLSRRFKTGCAVAHRKYSQSAAAAATVVLNTAEARPGRTYASDGTKPSFAKSLYVGNFISDVFARRVATVDVPKLENLFAVSVPREFGGLGLSASSISEAYKTAGFGDFRDGAAHGSVAKCIDACGTSDQKRRYLPQLASGERVATFCVYERQHGYDIPNTETTASCVDGRWVINGSKQWVVNGGRADVLVVLAQTMDECNRPESDQTFYTAFLVDRLSRGVEIANEGEHYNVTFNNVQADCVLGPENEGLMFYTMFFHGDLIESSSATLGELKRIIQNVSENVDARDRSSLIKLGTLNSHLYTMECVIGFTSMILDTYNRQSDYEPILARLFVNETSYSCLNLLYDLGLPRKSLKYIDNSLLVEGRANLLAFVGALLGIQHAGQFMAEDVKQLRNPLMFPKYTLSHILRIQRLLKDKPKLSHNIEKYLHPNLKKQALDLEYCLSKFQFGVQHMFVNLGPDTYLFQMILERANNIAMSLFAMTAVLHKVSHNLSNSNIQQYPTELIFANVFCNNIREHCRIKVNEILNAPHNVVDPHFKALGTNCFREKNYFLEHPLKRNIC